jgi:hypothetical protein
MIEDIIAIHRNIDGQDNMNIDGEDRQDNYWKWGKVMGLSCGGIPSSSYVSTEKTHIDGKDRQDDGWKWGKFVMI